MDTQGWMVGSKSDCGIIMGDRGAFPAFSRVFRMTVNDIVFHGGFM